MSSLPSDVKIFFNRSIGRYLVTPAFPTKIHGHGILLSLLRTLLSHEAEKPRQTNFVPFLSAYNVLILYRLDWIEEDYRPKSSLQSSLSLVPSGCATTHLKNPIEIYYACTNVRPQSSRSRRCYSVANVDFSSLLSTSNRSRLDSMSALSQRHQRFNTAAPLDQRTLNLIASAKPPSFCPGAIALQKNDALLVGMGWTFHPVAPRSKHGSRKEGGRPAGRKRVAACILPFRTKHTCTLL
ncbi:hypothetical protein P153DRAFT_405202 [Dothidotthia symphoricarpi CBS 119687]|uniref:Uncharacterized protein n=1 Tax=Dothidotthia symphoricarpi CBS 119687 TaxID=1392245 RepID=A0A6A6ABC0_9PLEO|nr:uncharacterized protein P153DRAFT_405202 [Dothidotthia symphoricarpi CBS 119687]KAF2128001.1 hypothetical protein P153DRAFT_405202 [Dothidotthia symphoricarpi CBS 119687]